MNLPPHQNELYRRTDEVLHYIWDPIGVAGVPEARDEYDSYLPHVFSLLINNPKAGEIQNYLITIEGNNMGLDVSVRSRNRAKEVEEILTNFRDAIYEKAGLTPPSAG
jgi:hypothetical protein